MARRNSGGEVVQQFETRRELPVAASQTAILAAGHKLAEGEQKVIALLHQRKETHKLFSGQIEAQRGENSKLSRIVLDGTEIQSVACQETRDYGKGRIKIVRLDNGETVEDRDMKPDELQTELIPPSADQFGTTTAADGAIKLPDGTVFAPNTAHRAGT